MRVFIYKISDYYIFGRGGGGGGLFIRFQITIFSVGGGGGGLTKTERRRPLIHFICFLMIGNCRKN